ncbi:MAG: hypothetical protein J7L89_10055 [Bacteroidales bacterium]|nr:hypothetical protein [Bacteroidales bacterium]
MSFWFKRLFIGSLLILPATLSSFAQETRIIIHSADSTLYDQRLFNGMQRSIGHVMMQHKDLTLYCDSAHFDQEKNLFIGFSRVHLIKADTINIYTKQINYDGTNETARLKGDVRMVNGRIRLTAPVLDYDMATETGWYFGGGQIIDTANTVESYWGYYYVDKNEFFFKQNVTLSNDESTLVTDTLRYRSDTEEMWFNGLTQIFGDTNYIECRKGYYNTQESFSLFQDQVFMQSRDQILKGDSLVYHRDNGNTEAFNHVEMQDTTEHLIIRGTHLSYNEKSGWFRMSREVEFIRVEDQDSLFMHADTLISFRDTVAQSRHIKAFPRVQFFRTDLQGRCLNLDYVISDSLINMYGSPVIWQKNNQLTADSTRIYLASNGIEHIQLMGSGFIITQNDTVMYDQIKGKDITGWFDSGKLCRVNVEGNGECLFYPDDNGQIIGLFYSACSTIRILFIEGKINNVIFITEPDSKLLPLKQLKESDRFLDGFNWMESLHPHSAPDIFIWKK